MKQKWIKYGVVTLAASSLLLQNGLLPAAPVAAAAAPVSISNQIVKLSASSYLNIREAHFLMQEKGKVLAFSVAITNNGSSEINLIDYWLRVKTKSGKTFKTTLTEGDKTKTTVAPKTTQYITYYTVVDNQTTINDLSFEVVKWDFSQANYERRLGVIKYPANTTDRIAAFQGSVMLYNSNKIKGAIKQSFITKDANSAYLTINFLLENVGQQAVDLSKMNFFVQTDSFSVYNVDASGLDQVSIQPKERKIVTLHATVPLVVAGKPLSFVVALNDEASKVTLPSGVFNLPSVKPAAAVEFGQKRAVYMDGTPINTQVGTVLLTQGTDKNQVEFNFTLNNIGTTSIANPSLDYFLMTPSGISYPLTYTKEENSTLLPNIEKVISLTGDIPTTVKPETGQLVVKTTATDKAKSYIIGNYKMQKSTPQVGGLNSAFKYNDYSVKLVSIQRSPIEDNDMLVANLAITNQTQITKQVPALGGYFLVNGVKVGTEQKIVGLDDAVTIAPGASYNAIVYAQIPYTTAIDTITFVSTETIQDKAGKTLYQFSGQKLSDIPTKSTDASYDIMSIGKRSSIKIARTAIFTGDSKDTFYAELEAINNENRAALVAKLGAYIVDKNGIVVPVQFAEIKDKLSPTGKALVSAWAPVSKQFDKTAYQLIVGQALSNSTGGSTGTSTGETPSDGGGTTDTSSILVNPVSYSLNNQNTVPTKSDFTDIQFAGFNLTLHHIIASLNVSGQFSVEGLKMAMDYSLAKDTQYELITGDHKLMFEFVNKDNRQVTYTKQFGLLTAGTNEELLKEGESAPLEFTIADTAIQSKINQYQNYTLNIYDVFQNSKLLVASRDLQWFSVSN
ncbi:hypothetical protein ACFPYJ_29090 [Paenibacillus solisilvae]|uniref:Uncharacterized protein n=1 Tax=Paenibacillus solisilvae TaxID=2486751 RepID=A0ABW0W7N9_9BACL